MDAGMADAAVGRKPRLGIPGQLLCPGLVAADMTLNFYWGRAALGLLEQPSFRIHLCRKSWVPGCTGVSEDG